MFKELLAQFDELINPFASDNYKVLSPSSYSSKYQAMPKKEYGNIFRLSLGDTPKEFDPEHINYRISGVDWSPCPFFTEYDDKSSPSHPDEEDSFTPHLSFNYYYNPDSEISRRILIYHSYDKYAEKTVISFPDGDTLSIDVNKSTKYNYYLAKAKKEAIEALKFAIKELKKNYVGSICTPMVNKNMVAQTISQ